MPSYDRALWALRAWLDSWSGIGHVAVGMHRQGYDLQLTQYDDRGWRATFHTTGMEHSPVAATGTAWERTPWHATIRAKPRNYHRSAQAGAGPGRGSRRERSSSNTIRWESPSSVQDWSFPSRVATSRCPSRSQSAH